MHALDAKVPPPLVAIAVAMGMWALVYMSPNTEARETLRFFAVGAVASLSAAFVLAGFAELRRAKTTLNPVKPERTNALVTSGVYRLTRNPMYFSLLLLLIAYAIYLWALTALVGPIAFIAYITRFQIIPEERVLEAKFGSEFAAYRRRVRRWI